MIGSMSSIIMGIWIMEFTINSSMLMGNAMRMAMGQGMKEIRRKIKICLIYLC